MDIDEVRELYITKELSVKDVGEKLHKSVWQVVAFMRKHNIKRRSNFETRRLQYQRQALSYHKKAKLSKFENELYYAGMLLYWGEGAKSGHGTVDFANSNSKMITIFLLMLRMVFNVDEKRLRVLLYCYANQDVENLISYWSNLLQIPNKQFTKPYIRQDYNFTKIGKMPHGLVHIRYNDKKLFKQINEEIAIIADKLIDHNCWDTEAVKRA